MSHVPLDVEATHESGFIRTIFLPFWFFCKNSVFKVIPLLSIKIFFLFCPQKPYLLGLNLAKYQCKTGLSYNSQVFYATECLKTSWTQYFTNGQWLCLCCFRYGSIFAVKLRQDFDALCEMIYEFSSGHICACYLGLGHFHLDGANFKIQTHLVCKIMHQKWLHFYGSCITAKLGYIVGPWYWLVSIFYKLKGDSNNESKLWHHQLN